MKKRKIKDIILQSLTYLFSSFGVLVLVSIIVFIFSRGFTTLSWNMLISDNAVSVVDLSYDEENTLIFENEEIKDSYYSTKWGIALKDEKDNVGNSIVIISYINESSPLRGCKNITTDESYSVKINSTINKIMLVDENGSDILAISNYKAQKMVDIIDKGVKISDIQISTPGGGIRGSLLTTLLLIVITLLFSLPLGIGAAIFLSEYAKDNKFTQIIRTLIDMTGGIPSIIFGLVGATIFIPFLNKAIKSSGTSIMAGALTLSIMLLPVIIRTTEETLRTIPNHFRNSSLALGASKTQTIFKIVLPNALSGILTAILLAIGRIIGESAALIYTMGTAIKDSVAINANSTSLAVHIWSIMAGDNPNYDGACAIAIIILLVVLILNITVKILSKKINKFEVRK